MSNSNKGNLVTQYLEEDLQEESWMYAKEYTMKSLFSGQSYAYIPIIWEKEDENNIFKIDSKFYTTTIETPFYGTLKIDLKDYAFNDNQLRLSLMDIFKKGKFCLTTDNIGYTNFKDLGDLEIKQHTISEKDLEKMINIFFYRPYGSETQIIELVTRWLEYYQLKNDS